MGVAWCDRRNHGPPAHKPQSRLLLEADATTTAERNRQETQRTQRAQHVNAVQKEIQARQARISIDEGCGDSGSPDGSAAEKDVRRGSAEPSVWNPGHDSSKSPCNPCCEEVAASHVVGAVDTAIQFEKAHGAVGKAGHGDVPREEVDARLQPTHPKILDGKCALDPGGGSVVAAGDEAPNVATTTQEETCGAEHNASSHLAAFRALVTLGDTAAIELVLKIGRDHLKTPESHKGRVLKLEALQKRAGGASSDGYCRVLSALQAAGFACIPNSETADCDGLTLPSSAPAGPLRDLVRMLERTRGVYWTPTQLPKEEEPEPHPDEWRMISYPDVGGFVIKEKDAELWSQTFRRTGSEARTWRGGHTPRVTVSFINLSTSEALSYSWIDSRSLNPTEQPWGEIAPAQTVEQHTFVSHAFVIRLPGGPAIGGYVPTEPGPGAHHVVGIGRHKILPTLTKFEETAQELIRKVRDRASGWRDTAQDAQDRALRGAGLAPRPLAEQWAVAAWPPLSGMEIPEADADVWAGTHRSVGMEGRSWRGAQTQKVNLIFVNCGHDRVGVSWLDIHHNMRERWDYNVEPGGSQTQGTFIYHAWVFRDTAGRAVGGYVPMDTAESTRHVVFFGPRASLPQGEELSRRAASFQA